MADGIRIGLISLYDNWPGPVNPNLGRPSSGWCVTSCPTTAAYPAGTKIMAYSDATINPGWFTMMYGQIACSSTTNAKTAGAPEGDVSVFGLFCGHCDITTDVADTTYVIEMPDASNAPPMYVLTGCWSASTDLTKGGPLAVACGTMNAHQWGWFWVGGVPPVLDVTKLQGALSNTRGAEITAILDINSRVLYVTDVSGEQVILACGVTDGTRGLMPAGFCDATNG